MKSDHEYLQKLFVLVFSGDDTRLPSGLDAIIIQIHECENLHV